MAFSQASITSILPPLQQGSDLKISWTSTSPPSTTYQLYINRVLTAITTNTYAVIPMPSSQISIDVGTVLPSEAHTDFSADLAVAPSDKAELNWCGGTFLDPAISGFFVYSGGSPGASVDFTNALANIPAYTGGVITDGFGLGGFGFGGFGESAATYNWTSNVLAYGTWNFAVSAYDAAGNVGPPVTVSVQIQSPPQEVAPFPDGTRLHYTYDSADQIAVLTWNASPSA